MPDQRGVGQIPTHRRIGRAVFKPKPVIPIGWEFLERSCHASQGVGPNVDDRPPSLPQVKVLATALSRLKDRYITFPRNNLLPPFTNPTVAWLLPTSVAHQTERFVIR